MNRQEAILKEIDSIRSSASDLYSYLYDLVYEGKVKDIQFLAGIYLAFLSDDRASIRQVSIYALLFGLKIRKECYKQKGLDDMETDINDDSRRAGIEQTFREFIVQR